MDVRILNDFCEEVAKEGVVVVVGAGVSILTTGDQAVDDHHVAGWLGLIRHGLERCRSLHNGNQKWYETVTSLIDLGEKGHLPSLLAAADLIQQELQQGSSYSSQRSNEFRSWLDDTVGRLQLQDATVLETLDGMGLPLVTTNYDHLVEEVTKRDALTWADEADIKKFLVGEHKGVIHLHGDFKQPETVTLGIRDYQAILANDFAQFIMRVLVATRTLLFVGFGAGWEDPNFSALLRWAEGYMGSSAHHHYRLLTERQMKKEEERGFQSPKFLRALVHGDDFVERDAAGGYSTLARFLTKIRLIAERKRTRKITVNVDSRISRPADKAFLVDERVLDQAERWVKDQVSSVVVLRGAVGSSRGLVARHIARSCDLLGYSRHNEPRFGKVLWMAIPLVWWRGHSEVLGEFHAQTVLDLTSRLLTAFDQRDMANLSFDKQLRRLNREISNKRALIVIEGIEKVLEFDEGRRKVSELLRDIPTTGCMLVTSATALDGMDGMRSVEVSWHDSTLINYYVEGLCEEKKTQNGRIVRLLQRLLANTPLLDRPAVWQWAIGSEQAPDDIAPQIEKLIQRREEFQSDGHYSEEEVEAILGGLFEILIGPVDESDRRVLLALSFFANPPDMDQLQPTTGLTQREVEDSLNRLERRLVVWRMWPNFQRLYATTLTLACTVRLYAGSEGFREVRRCFVAWAVRLAENHGDWEQNTILMKSLVEDRDNLRMAFEVAAKLDRGQLADEDWYTLGRTVGQLHHLNGSWEIGDRCYERVLGRLSEEDSKPLVCRVKLLQVRSLAHKGREQEAVSLVDSMMPLIESEEAKEPSSPLGHDKTWGHILAEAKLRKGHALHRDPARRDQAKDLLRQAILAEDLFTSVSASGYLAEIFIHENAIKEARPALDSSIKKLSRTSWDRIKAHHERLRGEVFLAQGEKLKAREAFRRAESYRVGADARLRGWIYSGLAQADESLTLEKRLQLAEQAQEVFSDLELREDQRRLAGIVEMLNQQRASQAKGS
jgi:tetratricopeptide (TPR) repeat protein